MRQPAVTIEFCLICGYQPRATALGEAIEREFSVKPKLVEASGGVFEVKVDGRLVFSKRATCRFPEHDEIFFHVKQAAEAGSR